MVKQAKNPLVLSFTNKAVENVKSRLDPEMDAKKICFTFDSYFCEQKGRGIDSLENKTIFSEEFSMVPSKWMTLIYKAYTKYGNIIYMFGDTNQCAPVEGGSQINYDYLHSQTVREMCPRIKTLEYIEGPCRYDKETHEVLKTFLKLGRISKYFQPIDKKL